MPNAVLVRHGRDGPVTCPEEGEHCPACCPGLQNNPHPVEHRAHTKAETKAALDNPDCPPDFKIGGVGRDALRASEKAFDDAWTAGTSWNKSQIKAWIASKQTHAGEPTAELLRRWVE